MSDCLTEEYRNTAQTSACFQLLLWRCVAVSLSARGNLPLLVFMLLQQYAAPMLYAYSYVYLRICV